MTLGAKRSHEGQTCLLLANGPSLDDFPLELVPPSWWVIGMNGSWRKARASYHVLVDRQHAADLWNGKWGAGYVFAVAQAIPPEQPGRNLRPLPWIENIPHVSDDFDKGVIGGSVAFIALQVAAWLGFTRIRLAGVDWKPGKDGRGHFWEGSHPMNPGLPAQQKVQFQGVAAVFWQRRIEVLNLNPSSLCRVWPRVTLEEAVRRERLDSSHGGGPAV